MRGKHDLRHQFRELRRAVDAPARSAASRDAGGHAHRWLAGRGARRVALFVSLTDEIDTEPLFTLLRAGGVEVVLPRVRLQETALDFVIASDLNNLQPGPFRLLEPRGEVVPLSTVDVVVVPGLAFDRRGGRLGYGAGYYDRCLAAFAGTALGYCYGFQLVEDPLPLAPHDRPMNAIATDGGVHIP